MRLEALRSPRSWEPSAWSGAILCSDLRDADGRTLLHKGHRLGRADQVVLDQARAVELHLLWLEAGDVDEDTAALRLARLAAGDGVEVGRPIESQVRLSAGRRGLLRVDSERLRALNASGDCTIFALSDGTPVDADRSLAGVKITPLAIAECDLRAAERAAAGAPLLRVAPFAPLRIAAVVRERLSEGERERFELTLGAKVRWFGGSLLPARYLTGAGVDEVAPALLAAATDADVVLVAGVASTDPLDATWRAVLDAGASEVRRGLPVHPGSSYWIVELLGACVIGVASCGIFSRRTALDLLLVRRFAGELFDEAYLAGLGEGGLLASDMGWRIPSYSGRGAED